jgi:4-aminobutyrate aminotransferase
MRLASPAAPAACIRFACEHFVTPDVLVPGKSPGGGLLPFAGIVTHEKYNR